MRTNNWNVRPGLTVRGNKLRNRRGPANLVAKKQSGKCDNGSEAYGESIRRTTYSLCHRNWCQIAARPHFFKQNSQEDTVIFPTGPWSRRHPTFAIRKSDSNTLRKCGRAAI